MAGQKRATKLEYLKILSKFNDNDILLIDTRKDPWIKKVGSITSLEPEFLDIEKEAINYATKKARSEGKDFKKLTNERDIIHMFIGSRLNGSLCKSYPIEEVNAELMDLFEKYKLTI